MSVAVESATGQPRYCLTLVLAPALRSNDDSASYKPFEGKALLELFDELRRKVPAHHRSPLFEKHAIYNNLYFGARALSPNQISELRRLSSAIVDCAALAAKEPDAVATAVEALREFMYDAERLKKLILTCRERCGRTPEQDHEPVYSDEGLFHALWGDLCGNLFVLIHRRMELRSR